MATLLDEAECAARAGNFGDARALLRSAQQSEGNDQSARVRVVEERICAWEASVSARRFQCMFNVELCSVYKIDVPVASRHELPSKSLLYTGSLQLLTPLMSEPADGAANDDDDRSLLILRVGTKFQYPLSRSVPVLAVVQGTYVLASPSPAIFFAVCFPDDVPAAYCSAFESIIETRVSLRRRAAAAGPDAGAVTPAAAADTALSTTRSTSLSARALSGVSSGVAYGSKVLASGVSAAGSAVSKGVERSAVLVKSHLQPAQKETRVPQPIKATFSAAKSVTPHFVYVSNAVVTALVDVACATGEVIGSQVAHRLRSDDPAKQRDSPGWQAARELGRTTLEGAVTVWEALDEAALAVYSSAGKAATEITAHKWGDEVASVARDGVSAGRDLLETTHNVKGVVGKKGAKRIAKKMARKAATEAVSCYFLDDDHELLQLTSSAGPDHPAQVEDELVMLQHLRSSTSAQLFLISSEDLTEDEDVVIASPM